MNTHTFPEATLVAIAAAAPFAVDGAAFALVGPIRGEVMPKGGRRKESVLVHREEKRVYVYQHIRLPNGQTVSAPYLSARGVG